MRVAEIDDEFMAASMTVSDNTTDPDNQDAKSYHGFFDDEEKVDFGFGHVQHQDTPEE
jgi:hypothetical protein